MATLKFPHVNTFYDSRGKLRHVFRRKGHKRITLKGRPGDQDFMQHYHALLESTGGDASLAAWGLPARGFMRRHRRSPLRPGRQTSMSVDSAAAGPLPSTGAAAAPVIVSGLASAPLSGSPAAGSTMESGSASSALVGIASPEASSTAAEAGRSAAASAGTMALSEG